VLQVHERKRNLYAFSGLVYSGDKVGEVTARFTHSLASVTCHASLKLHIQHCSGLLRSDDSVHAGATAAAAAACSAAPATNQDTERDKVLKRLGNWKTDALGQLADMFDLPRPSGGLTACCAAAAAAAAAVTFRTPDYVEV
jgi:hypothetical protein